MSADSVAQVLPPPAFPANRLFFRLCKSLHNRKNSLFAGSEGGGNTWATIATLLQTAKMNDVDPLAWLTQTLLRMANGWPAHDIEALMPWNFKPDVVG